MSNYLNDPLAFEKTIRKGIGYSRSRYLDNVVDIIKESAPDWDDESLQELTNAFDLWLEYEADEVESRFSEANIKAFEAEIENEGKRIQKHSLAMHKPPDSVAHRVWLDPAPQHEILAGHLPDEALAADFAELDRDRQGNVKQGANVVRNVALPSVSVAQAATHSVGLSSVVTGGGVALAGISATGVGLLATGAALAAVSSGLAIRSAVRTDRHLLGLQHIYNNRASLPCSNPNDGCHEIVADQVLPYIIFQKSKKLGRKKVAAIPIIGGLQGLRGVVRKAQKWHSGTLGVRREKAAKWLAAHLLGTRCLLVQVVIRELFATGPWAGNPDLRSANPSDDGKDGSPELASLRVSDYGDVWPILARKLKST